MEMYTNLRPRYPSAALTETDHRKARGPDLIQHLGASVLDRRVRRRRLGTAGGSGLGFGLHGPLPLLPPLPALVSGPGRLGPVPVLGGESRGVKVRPPVSHQLGDLQLELGGAALPLGRGGREGGRGRGRVRALQEEEGGPPLGRAQLGGFVRFAVEHAGRQVLEPTVPGPAHLLQDGVLEGHGQVGRGLVHEQGGVGQQQGGVRAALAPPRRFEGRRGGLRANGGQGGGQQRQGAPCAVHGFQPHRVSAHSAATNTVRTQGVRTRDIRT